MEQEVVATDAVAHLNVDGATFELVGVSDAVYTTDRTDNNDVASTAQQSRRGAQAQFVQVVVNGKVFLYICVRGGNVGFGLVVVIVRNEVFHRVVRKELLEFTVELGCKGFVVAEDKGRTLELGNDIGNGEGFAAARDTL